MKRFELLGGLILVLGLAATAVLAQGQPAAAAAPAAARPVGALDPSRLPRVEGEALAHTCSACHGTHGRLGDEAFMPLAGMPSAEFVVTMQDFRSGKRPATLMGHVARGLSDADLVTMGAYFAAQAPAAGSAAALLPGQATHGAPR